MNNVGFAQNLKNKVTTSHMLRCKCSNNPHTPQKKTHCMTEVRHTFYKRWSKSSNILFASQETCQISNSNCDFQIFLFPDSKSQLIQSTAGQKQIEYPVPRNTLLSPDKAKF